MREVIAENNKFTVNNLWQNPTFCGSVTKFQFDKLQNCWTDTKVPCLSLWEQNEELSQSLRGRTRQTH